RRRGDGAERGIRRAGAPGRRGPRGHPFRGQADPAGGRVRLGPPRGVGGGGALCTPYGMTGARIMCTLLNDLDEVDGTIGLETMCVGGGQGMAMVVERPR